MPAAALTCWHLLATAAGMAAGGLGQGGRCCGPVSLSHSPIWCDVPPTSNHHRVKSQHADERCTLQAAHLASRISNLAQTSMASTPSSAHLSQAHAFLGTCLLGKLGLESLSTRIGCLC